MGDRGNRKLAFGTHGESLLAQLLALSSQSGKYVSVNVADISKPLGVKEEGKNRPDRTFACTGKSGEKKNQPRVQF